LTLRSRAGIVEATPNHQENNNMRLIGLLLALLAVGWLVMTQLKSTPTPTVDGAGTTVKAPRNAEELKAFEDQVNRLSDQQNAKTREALEQIQ